jgi:uncharacterized protein (TIGR03067 family)
VKLLSLLAVLAVSAFGQDLEKLQGTWKIVSLKTEGASVSPEIVGTMSIVISGSHFTTSGMGDTDDGTLDVDAAASPKTLAIHFTSGPEKGNTSYAIYVLDGDHWRMCLNMHGARPTEFAADRGMGNILEELQRVAVSDLEGEWSMVSGTSDGRPLPAGYVRMGKRVVSGNEMTVTFGSELYSKATFTVDRSKSPIAIDIQNSGGAYAGKLQYGIYERNGKTLKLSIAAPGRDRPADFNTSPGDGRSVVVWTLP